MFLRFNERILGGLTLAIALSSAACSGEAATGAGSSVEDPTAQDPGSQNPGAAGNAVGAAGGSNTAPDDDADGLDVGGASMAVGGGGGGNFMECAGQALAAQPIGLDMYVVLDRSGSMKEDDVADNMDPGDCALNLAGMPANASKWCLATHALAKYFASPGAANNRAGLQYMPLEGEEIDGDDVTNPLCQSGGTITQAEVPLSALPIVGATDALAQSLDVTTPDGDGTPIEAALHGITTFTANNKDGNRVMIGVFITDGQPNGCNEVPTTLAQVLSTHLTNTSLKTFVIGMNGADDATLETLGIAGGAPPHMDFCGTVTPPCHYWNVGAGDPAAFASALAQIQLSAALPCDFNIPPPPDTQDLDPDLVNVTFTNLGAANVLGRVNDATACTGDGWYYDNPTTPTKVQLCPTTCTTAESAGQDAKVDITFGCATIIQ
jgi:Mg-chelatase subunit ChlD